MTSKRKSARYFGLYEAKNKKIRKQLALSTPIESVGNKNEVKERDLRPVLTVNLTPNSVGQLEGESSAVVSNSSVIVTQIVGYENNPPPTTPSTFSFKDYISTPIKALTPTTATTTVYNTPNEGMNYPLHRISLGKEGIESPPVPTETRGLGADDSCASARTSEAEPDDVTKETSIVNNEPKLYEIENSHLFNLHEVKTQSSTEKYNSDVQISRSNNSGQH